VKDDKEHIDKLFESLNDRQFDIPEAFLADLNKRLDNNEPKKRRFFFLWFLAMSHHSMGLSRGKYSGMKL